MDYNFLGTTGLKLSSVGFGLQTLGWNVSGKEAYELLDIYTACGGNYLDTADVYNDGKSEILLGEWLKSRKNNDDLIVGTKTHFATGDGPNDVGSSRKHINHAVERSLKRFGMEAIDLLQVHCYDGAVAAEELMLTLDDLVRAGKIRYFGVSNYTASALMKAIMIQYFMKSYRIASVQLEYSLLVRSSEWELIPVCEQESVGIITWSPLAGGWLTGKYRKDVKAPDDSRVGRRDRWDDQEDQRGGKRTWEILDVLRDIAKHRNASASQVALNWLRKKSGVTTVLMGARTPEQIKMNLGCLEWDLNDSEEALLDDISFVQPPSPYNFIKKYSRTLEEE